MNTANTSPDRNRPPIKHRNGADCLEIIAAIISHRLRWPKWSPNYRPTARWDIEAALVAEMHHSQRRQRGYYGYTNAVLQGSPLPREVAAIRALNALHHVSASTRQVRDQLRIVRSQRAAASDQTQSEKYRVNWWLALDKSVCALALMRRRRAREWRTFHELLAVYRETVRAK